MAKLTQERLRSLLKYDPETGAFTWLKRLGKGRVGDTAGSPQASGYLRIMIDGERFLAHRLAWFYVHGAWPSDQIDHVNKDNADNRIANLREATASQNQANRGAMGSTGFKGVSFHQKQQRYFARIKINRKLIHLGCFTNPEDAHAAYVAAANEAFGEFARAS